MGILILTSSCESRTGTRKRIRNSSFASQTKDAAGALNYFSCSRRTTGWLAVLTRWVSYLKSFVTFQQENYRRSRIFGGMVLPAFNTAHRRRSSYLVKSGGVPADVGQAGGYTRAARYKLHLFSVRKTLPEEIMNPLRLWRTGLYGKRGTGILAASANKLERKNTLFCCSLLTFSGVVGWGPVKGC